MACVDTSVLASVKTCQSAKSSAPIDASNACVWTPYIHHDARSKQPRPPLHISLSISSFTTTTPPSLHYCPSISPPFPLDANSPPN